VRDRVRAECEQLTLRSRARRALDLKPAVDTLFDAVLVMAEDPKVRAKPTWVVLRAVADGVPTDRGPHQVERGVMADGRRCS
jgi:glycyl-tRNA synthetase beta subunit